MVTNNNDKMSFQVYRNIILEGVVSKWLAKGDQFILEEDGDSSHGGGNCRPDKIARVWKEEHGLKHYFNPASSPDLSPIENCWRAVRQYIKAQYRLGLDPKALILKGWRRISEEIINKWWVLWWCGWQM